jgi:hypothetical protein
MQISAGAFLPFPPVRGVVLACGLLAFSCSGAEPPCFDGTYEVEFLERLPESDCPEAWSAGWTFTVEPLSVTEKPAVCRTVGLRVIGDAPPRDLGHAVASVVFPYPFIGAGLVDQPLDGDPSECEARTTLGAMIPDVGYTSIAEATQDDAVIWGVYVNDITSACGVTVPNGGRCSDFYRSRMVKIADWSPE